MPKPILNSTKQRLKPTDKLPTPKNRLSSSKKPPALPINNSQISVVFRHLQPSWRSYIDYARVSAKSGNEDMIQLIKCFDQLKMNERATIMPEQLCDLAGIPTSSLVGSVCAALWTGSQQEAAIITSVAHPRIVEKLAKIAQTVKGSKERESFLKATGFIPTPKPAGITVNVPAALAASPQSAVKAFLPSMESDMIELEAVESTPLKLISSGEGDTGDTGEESNV